MEEWAVLTPVAENQKFNTFDGSVFAWEGFWPRFAGWYGLEWEGPKDDAEYASTETAHSPRGYGGKGIARRSFTLVQWAKQEKVQSAWKKLANDNDLSQKDLVDIDRVFGFADGSLSRSGALMMRYDQLWKLNIANLRTQFG